MIVLGISCFYHDAAAVLLVDGDLIAAAEEERFSRVKHDKRFPLNAINFCLRRAGIKLQDLDYAAFYEKPLLKVERSLSILTHTFPKSLQLAPSIFRDWTSQGLHYPRWEKTLKPFR